MTPTDKPEGTASPVTKVRHGLRNIKAATDLATLAAGQVASKALAFVAFAVLARMLTPGNYGAVETVAGMVAIGHMVIEFGSGTLGIRRVASGTGAIADIAAAAASSRLLVAAVIVPLLIAAYAAILGQRTPVLLIALFGVSLFGAVLKLDWLLQAKDRMGAAAAGITLKMAVFLIVILVYSPSSFGVEAVGWAECLSMAAMGLYFLLAQRRAFGFGLSFAGWRDGMSFFRASAPLGLAGFAYTAAQALPVLIIQAMSTPTEAGEFGAAQRAVVSLLTFSWIYYQNLFPLLTRQITENPDEARRLVNSSDIFTLWTGAAAGVMLALGAQPLMRIAFGEGLAGSALEFSVLAWCLPLTLASGSARWLLIAQDRQKSQLAAQVIAAAVTLIATAV
ncbi:MAG: oligosaccharide flippase family protein, partial [Beijerinckiaceae bacterium]|nr:oligosaccharide flippase family protein [Beijerinckiaceae bacterium]